MKKIIAMVSVLALSLGVLAGCSSSDDGAGAAGEVRVYNWGDYIAPEVVEMFEEETGISVVYDTFDTNEAMYLKLNSTSGYTYDVAIPSDYMIYKMIEEDMLAPLNFDNMPNAAGVDPKFNNPAYDPDNMYSVPYIWGTVCLAYAPELVTDPVDSWSILWDDKYAGQVFMMDSERDTIGVALKMLGYSLNTTDEAELNEARDALIEQKPNVLAWTNDDIKDKLIGREGAIGVIWTSDIGLIREQDETIQYAMPKEGSNVWYDAAVILKDAENKENGEKFIDFLCRPDIAALNADYMGAASPITAVVAEQDPLITEDPIVNPTAEDLENLEVFYAMGDVAEKYEEIWSDVRAS